MINNPINVSRYSGIPPATENDVRAIAGGPIYARPEVLELAKAEQTELWSNGAINDGLKWHLDYKDVAELISLAMKSGSFLGSEWCLARPNGPWAACDAYKVAREEWVPNAHKYMTIGYYVKFAVSKTGKLLLSASNHPQGT